MTSHSPPARTVVLLSLAAFASSLSLRVCDPLLPQLAQTFATTTGDAAKVVTAFSVTYGLMQIVYGPLGDRFGKYQVIALATLCSVVGSIGGMLAPTLFWLIVARALVGGTAAAIIPLAMAWVGDKVAYDIRQATLARFLTGQIMGIVGGQFLGGLLADTLGWHWCFGILSTLFLVIGGLLLLELKRDPVLHAPAVDQGPPPAFRRQMHGVLVTPWVRVILLTVFVEGMLVFGTLAFIPAFLHQRFGLSLTSAGAIVASFGLGGLSYTLIARRLLGRLGETGLAVGGAAVLCLAFLTFPVAPAWTYTLLASFLAGLGFYMFHNTLQTNATQMAPHARGTAVSLFACTYFLGQSAGVALAAILVDRAGPHWQFALAAAGLPLVGFGFRAALIRHRRQTAGVGE